MRIANDKPWILVVDKSAVTRIGLNALLMSPARAAGLDVEECAACTDEVLKDRGETPPLLVVFGPSQTPLEARTQARSVQVAWPDTALAAVLSPEVTDSDRQDLASRLSVCVLADAEPARLIGQALTSALLPAQTPGRRSRAANGGVLPLSARETEVAKLIALGYGRKEVAARLSLSIKTVETYKQRSMKKLHATGRPALIRCALEMGWLHS